MRTRIRGKAHAVGQRFAMCAMVTVCLYCPSGAGAHNYDIAVADSTQNVWDGGEADEKAYSASIVAIVAGSSNDVPFAPGDTTLLRAIKTSERHGAEDKRFLSQSATVATNVVAQIKLVKGGQFVQDSAYVKGWRPLAVMTLSDSTHGDSILYPKFKARGGTSWLYVRHVSGTLWAASLVRIVASSIEQDSLAITADLDSLPPAPVARFKWMDNDEIIWGTCAGNCCKVASTKAATQMPY